MARRPLPPHPKLVHTQCDLRDRAAREALAGVDVLWHLGFSLWREAPGLRWPGPGPGWRGPGPGAEGRGGEAAEREPGAPPVDPCPLPRMGASPQSVNELGTANVLRSNPGRIVFASSAAVYGAWPDNPIPLPEDWSPRPNRACRYAAAKLSGERRCLEAGVPALLLRIAAVLGPHADPRVHRAVSGYRRAVPAVAGSPDAIQFLDEGDAADALHEAGKIRVTGVLNVAPEDWLTAEQVAAVAGSRVVRLPLPVLLAGSELAFGLRLLPFGSDRAILLNGPLALDGGRAREVLEWRPTQSSAAVLRRALGSPARRQ